MANQTEYERRLQWLEEVMDRRELAGVLVDSPETVGYLTGYRPPATMYQGCFFEPGSAPVLIVRANNIPTAAAQSWCDQIAIYTDWEDPIEVLAETIGAAANAGPLGKDMDSMVMTASRNTRLGELVPSARWIDISQELNHRRATKSGEEVALHRRAAGIADLATQGGIRILKGGGELSEAGLEAHAIARRAGADDRRTVVTKRESVPAGQAPTMMIELVPAVSGYDARLIRTVATAKPDEEQMETARLVLDIQQRQIDAMTPGARAADVDALCREQILDTGLRESYPGLTGHGLGSTWNGRTTDVTYRFGPGAGWHLEPGMVFHMYTRARGFVIGDTVLVTDDGPETLTATQRRLFYPEPEGGE